MGTKYNLWSKDTSYLAPASIINKALSILSLERGNIRTRQFDCDVCCSGENIPAKNYYKWGEKDGLVEDWMDYNWCNPPFNDAKRWVQKASYEQTKGHTSILLIPARTETAYWHDYILHDENVKIYWLRKGTKFIDANTKQELGVFKNALALVLFKGIK